MTEDTASPEEDPKPETTSEEGAPADAPTVDTPQQEAVEAAGGETADGWPGSADATETTAAATAAPTSTDRSTDRRQALRVGLAAAAALALFGGGYAVGKASDDGFDGRPAAALLQRGDDDRLPFGFRGSPGDGSSEEWQQRMQQGADALEEWLEKWRESGGQLPPGLQTP